MKYGRLLPNIFNIVGASIVTLYKCIARFKEINFFKAGDAFVESNNGAPHYVKNVGKKPAILHVGVVSVVGMPTTINK